MTNVDYPKGFLEQADFGQMDDDDSSLMFYYSGQIHIRNVLNEIQSNLHPPESMYTPPTLHTSFKTQERRFRCRECDS